MGCWPWSTLSCHPRLLQRLFHRVNKEWMWKVGCQERTEMLSTLPCQRKGRRSGVQKRDGGAEALQNCWALPHSVPASGPHWALRPQAAKFNKTISEVETQETTSSEKQNGKIGSVHRKKKKKQEDLPSDLPWEIFPLKEFNVICPCS